MFTGIIQDVGKIISLESRQGGVRLAISTRLDMKTVRVGDSISVDGVCLTVVSLAGTAFTVEASPETLSRTTLLQARQGQRVNLEGALRMSDPLGGHLVAGHVDGTGEILEVSPEGNFVALPLPHRAGDQPVSDRKGFRCRGRNQPDRGRPAGRGSSR